MVITQTKMNSAPLVLVADDTVPTTTMLQRVFEYEGYQVHCVHDGITALEAAREKLPDLILLDINMPGMNGFEVLKRLREDTSTATIPTILITALGDLSDIVHGLQLGADDYVRKPFHWRELLARAQSKMRARKLEEALQRRTEELETLLRVSDELNQHLEIDEILDLVLQLTLDLVGGGGAIIYQLDEQNKIRETRYQKIDASEINKLDQERLVDIAVERNQPFMWTEENKVTPEYACGIVMPLQQDEQNRLQSVLILLNQQAWETNHLQLVTGIARQASMALRNAELYSIKASYALHLEDMVDERTHELRSAQQMLIRSEKLASIGRLAASIAHEINNPLLPIQINLDDMLEDLEAKKPINPEEIRRTQESVERIRRIVNRLLEFTGNSHIPVMGNSKPIDLNNLIQNVVELVRKSFEQQGQKIIVELTPIPPILGDKDGLEQVFMNLALNASEAMAQGGILTIRTEVKGESVVVMVSDNGSGIPEEIIETMFEPFISTKEDGNGLGLFVSYGIIQNHNGTIEVTSKVNTGTTFTIRLPMSAEIAAQWEKPAAVSVKGKTTKKRERKT
jgi:signal transduction histidine kinase/DNA-binding response OmpR family regulator